MPRYLDPKNDLIFKKVFGENKHLCISLLNSLLELNSPIVSIEYMPTELTPVVPDYKDSIVDVRCTDQKKRHFIVEMQMQWGKSFMKRTLCNAAKVYVRDIEKGGSYDDLSPVYSLNLIDSNFDKASKRFCHHYQILDKDDPTQQLEGIEFVFVELKKFKPKDASEENLKVLWLRYLTEMQKLENAPPELLEDKNVAEAVKKLEESSYSREELERYERIQDAILKHRAGHHDAVQEGRAEGEAERKKLAAALDESKKTLEANKAALEANKAALEANKAALEAKDAALEAMQREIAELRKLAAQAPKPAK